MVGVPQVFTNQNQYIAALAASYGALVIGMLFGWSAPASPRLVEGGEGNVPLNEDEFSWAVAFMPLGGTLIAIPCGYLLKSVGRKNTILFFVIPLMLGWILLTWAQILVMLYIGRFLQGLAAGAYGMAIPIYIGEIADQRIRGTVGSFFQLMLNMGMLISFSVSAGVNVFQLNIISGCLVLLFGPIFMLMPETPSFLVQSGQKLQAIEAVKWLQGPDCNVVAEVELLQSKQDERSNQPTKTLKNSLLSTGTISALIAMVGLVTFLQMSGINAVLFYATDIFMNASDSLNYTVATIIVGAMQVVGTILAAFVVDRVGRRWLLLISAISMCAAHVTLGVYFHLLHDSPEQVENLEWLPVLALSVFVTMFSIGFGPVPWIMIGEIFAADVKDLASSLAVITSNGLSFMMSKTFIHMQEGLGEAGTFWLFGGFCLLAVIFVVMFVPETKGKTFDQIQKHLRNSKVYCREEKNFQQ
ncbi:facilitated trehalose transporter Tret1-like [Anopheles ziemanni]|uniref:facilitated trehalose transporter Tret1-like n=1 Tax=Anopheles coustani TaxID=139045 RepID=UPI00265B4208|nr:facilitated trehalose transporter Tret1-like [Anopheles coustani]XP_058169245.1 facilitated trehalose transporter Tret1-like [Anopheles ziemanni]